MQNILENFQFKNNKKYLNECCEVLVENKLNGQEKFFGRTKFMTPVIFDSNQCVPGDLINLEVKSFNKKNLFGIHKTENIKAA